MDNCTRGAPGRDATRPGSYLEKGREQAPLFLRRRQHGASDDERRDSLQGPRCLTFMAVQTTPPIHHRHAAQRTSTVEIGLARKARDASTSAGLGPPRRRSSMRPSGTWCSAINGWPDVECVSSSSASSTSILPQAARAWGVNQTEVEVQHVARDVRPPQPRRVDRNKADTDENVHDRRSNEEQKLSTVLLREWNACAKRRVRGS